MNFTGYYTNAEQYTRNVGFSTNNETFKYLFSDDTLDFISSEVTKLLHGVAPGGRDIVVPHETIVSVLNNIYISYRPQTGDIYSRYNITQFEPRDDANHIITETIQVIASQIKSEYGMMENNYKLDIWDSVLLGDGISRKGLRQYAPIKLREKRPTPLLFNYTF
jgi:hypothetical protein